MHISSGMLWSFPLQDRDWYYITQSLKEKLKEIKYTTFFFFFPPKINQMGYKVSGSKWNWSTVQQLELM